MDSPEKILQQYWGYNSFRPLQREIIQSILDKKDTMALLPTGGGKSVCYQVPALIMEGLCLVISPLIALMQDQVNRLKKIGIAAECLHSGMKTDEVKRHLDNALHNAYQMLYISPERLQTNTFRDYLDEFSLSMVAVDEAHCISQWGHDFRPNYLKIASVREAFPQVPILALTATATADVRSDIIAQLKLRKPEIFRQSFSRDNIFYDVRYSENKSHDTLRNVDRHCSIIYCRSRRQTETTGKHLNQSGVATGVYHAGMAREKREESQERWMNHETPVMVATTAFGMGIDKPDVRMVLHYDAPEHLEAYYQEAGRAGRDGAPSVALGFYNSADIKRLEESIALQYPPEAYLRQVYQSVVEYLQIPIGGQPDQYFPFDLEDFCMKFTLVPTHAIHALKLLEREGLWTMSESVYHPATIRFVSDRHVLDRLNKAHPELGYVTIGLLRMYNTIFHFPTPVRETAIARRLKMKTSELESILDRLHQMEILEYVKPGEGPQLFFHHYRVDSRHLLIDLNRIHILRKRHEARTKAMVGFLENRTTCRERVILTYFGEKPKKDCGHCDICRQHQINEVDTEMLRKDLLKKISQGPVLVQELVAPYGNGARDEALHILRVLMDEGGVYLRENGEIAARK